MVALLILWAVREVMRSIQTPTPEMRAVASSAATWRWRPADEVAADGSDR